MSYHYNMLALIDGIQPRILGLQDIIPSISNIAKT